MSGIFLQSTEGGEVIEIPLGKTVIGRGPFLQITDKRVSRSHAELDVVDGTLYITPTHTNPCFLRRGGSDNQIALPKDERCKLSAGDVFGLLPEQLFFTVCSKSGALNGTSVKVKTEPQSLKGSQKTQSKVKDEELDEEEDEEDEPTPKKKAQNKGPAVVNVPGKHKMAMPLDKKRTLPDWMIRMAAIGPVPDKKKAKPTAKIPAVSKREAGSSASSSPRKRGPAKRYDDYDDDDFDEEEEERPQRRRARPSRRAASYNDDDDGDISPRRRPQRAARESRGSYVEELIPEEESDDSLPDHLKKVKDDDSDFELDDGGDSGSDWENRGKGRKGKSPKGKPPPPVRRTGRGRPRGRRAKNSDDDDGDDDFDPHAYVPRPSKRRGGAAKRKKYDESEEDYSEEEIQPRSKRTPAKKKKKDATSEEEDFSEEEIQPRANRTPAKKKKYETSEEEDFSEEEKPKAKRAPVKKTKDESSEEEEETKKKGGKRKKEESEEDDDDGKQAKKKPAGKKKRRKCQFGKKCYRKNEEHFESHCHPGDATFDESSEEDDDDKPACAYGAHCYRTNPQHLKDYSHKKAPARPQRKRAKDGKTSVVDRDVDDDGLPNTYDYNDSFIDDVNIGTSDSSSSYGEPEEDSDYDPGEEDVKSLMKEAKGFVKKKKMRQPVGKKIGIEGE